MNKKLFNLLFSFILICSLLLGIFFICKSNKIDQLKNSTSQNSSNKQIKKVYLDRNFVNTKSNFKEVLSSAELVVIGKVISSKPFDWNGLTHTDYALNVLDVLKAPINFNNSVTVRFIGGTLNGVEQIQEDVKHPNTSDTYLFAVKKIQDNIYIHQLV